MWQRSGTGSDPERLNEHEGLPSSRMERAFLITLIATTLGLTSLAGVTPAQTSLNVSLFGQFDPVPGRGSGSWGWTSPSGEEFALFGDQTGTSIVAIDDSTNIHEVGFFTGPTSNWRELTVVGDHAYAVSEGGTGDTGMQVFDLSGLPAQAVHVTTYTQTFTRAHIIQSDVYNPQSPYVYVMGTQTTEGVHILDVSNAANPVEIGLYDPPYYVHDAHVRGDRLYASAIFSAWIDIIDISDKTAPVFITRFTYPNAFTHSSWTTADNNYLVVTDERDGLPARVWDISDLGNITAVADFSANLQSLVHNPYGLGDLMFLSHNT